MSVSISEKGLVLCATEPALEELRAEAARLNQDFLNTLKQLSKQQHEVLQKMIALEEFRAML